MLIDGSTDLSTPNVPVSLSTDIHIQCPYCGVCPGQYHHPDCAYWNQTDDKDE